MKALFVALAFVTVAATSSGYASLPRDRALCPNAHTMSNTTLSVGQKAVELAQFSCSPSVLARKRQTTGPVLNICGEACQDVCSDSGSLPPTTEDCQTIVDAITILNGSVSPTFTVSAGNMHTLSFGTCRFFVENLSLDDIEYCWISFAQTASAAGTACFPPVQPVHSQGVCVSSDALWQVGAAHS